MDEQQRQSFRVEPHFAGELFHEGRVARCDVLNLSAGGARVQTRMRLASGAVCTLGIPLDGDLERAAGMSYVSFHMFVLDAVPQSEDELVDYRLQHVSSSSESAGEYELATKVVFASQRRDIAHESGADESSPMVSTRDRRLGFMSRTKARFSRGSTRGGQG
ncbi:MAG: PilZ domain-containing protein [Thermoleophilia bacterium]|nr:PilZ domain-containing protein [Thermoleophilia bacterium]